MDPSHSKDRNKGQAEDRYKDRITSSGHEVAVADGCRLAKRDDPTDSSGNNAMLEYKLYAKLIFCSYSKNQRPRPYDSTSFISGVVLILKSC